MARPELVPPAVLMATRGRQDRTRDFFRAAEDELWRPASSCRRAYDAKIRLLESFSPKTLNDDEAVARLDRHVHHVADQVDPGHRAARRGIAPEGNRLPAYRSITAPVLVIGFADDVVLPPHLGREVADAIPNGRYLEIPDAGHLGFIERPDAVNAAALEFFAASDAEVCATAACRRRLIVGLSWPSARIVAQLGCPGEPIDDTGPRRRRRADPRRRPRRRAVPGFAQRAAGLRAARRRPGRPRSGCTSASTSAPPGFLAIGLAVAAGAPVCVAMTSGTAVANLGRPSSRPTTRGCR